MPVRRWAMVAVFLGAMVPGQPLAERLPATTPDPCSEGPLVAVDLAGCTVAGCGDPAFVSGVLELADLVPGTVLDPLRRAAGLKRLDRMGFFHSASIACEAVVGGISATLNVEVATRLRRMKVTGNSHFDDSEIFGRLSMVPGDRFDTRDAMMADNLERAREAIRRAYQDEGFTGTEVKLEARPVDASRVDLLIAVHEGARVKIREVEVTLKPARPEAAAFRPDAEGCPVPDAGDLRSWTDLGSGTTMTERTLPNAISRLTKTLRSIGFSGVRVASSFDAPSEVLRLQATYESCYLLRFFVRDAPMPGRIGFVPQQDDDLLKALPFSDSGVFDLSEAQLGREEVRAFFENRGYLFADAVLDYRTRRAPATPADFDEDPRVAPAPWGPHVAGRITYFVTRNGKVEIRGVDLRGVKSLPEESIRKEMVTKEYDFFGDTGALLPDQVFTDLDRVRQLYAEEGFRDMRFLDTVPDARRVRLVANEGDATVYTYGSADKAFQVVVPPGDTEGVLLRIGIEEGRRSRVGKVRLDGVSQRPPAEAVKVLDLPPGGPLSPGRLEAAVQRLKRWYASSGHLRASVKVSCGAEEEAGPCDLQAATQAEVDLRIAVEEGTPATIESVFVQGLDRTRREVVASQLPGPGQPYDIVRVAEGIRYLNDLGIFASVQVSAIGADEEPPRDRVALVVECREQKNRFIDFAVGFETLSDARSGSLPKGVTSALSTSIAVTDVQASGSGRALDLPLPDILMTIEARYVDLNLLGRGKRLYLPLKYGFSFTAWDRYASFAPTYLDPNFFSRGLSFRATPFALYDRATTRLDQVQFGAEFVVSRALYQRLFGALAWETGAVRTRDSQVSGAGWSSWRYENKIVPTLTYDHLDHPIDPKNGGFVQVSLAYINALSQGNFLKYEILAKGFVTIRKFLTIGLTARFGGSKAFGGNGQLPPDERYSLGGNRGVRGFSNDGVGQYLPDGSLRLVETQVQEKNPDGTPKTDPVSGAVVTHPEYAKVYGGDTLVSGGLELRFPLLRSLALNGALFYDLGALSESPTDLNAKSVRHSVGLGLRYMLGGVVPIRLDYGIILDRRCKSVDKNTGKCTAREEVGNIHFGVLYTF